MRGLAPWPAAGPRAICGITLRSLPAGQGSSRTIDGGSLPLSLLAATKDTGVRSFAFGSRPSFLQSCGH